MHIKTIMCDPFTLVGLAVIRKLAAAKCWLGEWCTETPVLLAGG